MGLFGKLFEKKICDVCGGEIGLLGNRKLEDGNLCKECAKKLSPWFDDRRHSTLESIKEQLAYREENKKAVADFHLTRTLGDSTKVLLDEDAGNFIVTSASKWQDTNPDVIALSQVTGCRLDIDEDRDELYREGKDGQRISYVPPRYRYSYDFFITINVNSPYFNEIRFRMNRSSVSMETGGGLLGGTTSKPVDYREYERMGNDIVKALTEYRTNARAAAAAAAAPKTAVKCPYCGATTIPDASGRCEYCGGALNG
ncbi:MAG: DUF4428 domain-containing protein [Oscillospiraceae bacterium]|nr:DUF4428 domain-containing protein [Oscillospiraceae bacterium]